MRSLRRTGAPFAAAPDVVDWLTAVQSQDYGPAKWALGQRSLGVTDADVESAFRAGAILRTHMLRPTWQCMGHSARRKTEAPQAEAERHGAFLGLPAKLVIAQAGLTGVRSDRSPR
jgi:hypothetical protein